MGDNSNSTDDNRPDSAAAPRQRRGTEPSEAALVVVAALRVVVDHERARIAARSAGSPDVPERLTVESLGAALEAMGQRTPDGWPRVVRRMRDSGVVRIVDDELVATWGGFGDLGRIEWRAAGHRGTSVYHPFRIGVDDEGNEILVRTSHQGPVVRRGDDAAIIPDELAPDDLTVSKALELLARPMSGEPIGELDGCVVRLRYDRRGPYVEWGDAQHLPPGEQRPKISRLFASMSAETLTLADAERLLQLPRLLGRDPADGEEIVAKLLPSGPVVAKRFTARTLGTEEDLLEIDLAGALEVFAQPGHWRRPLDRRKWTRDALGMMVQSVSLTFTPTEVQMLLDGLQALEYWEYATELDLPRRNGQVFLPSESPTLWRHLPIGADEENAIVQIELARALRSRLSSTRRLARPDLNPS
ncbi:MAG: hypothetical protein ACO23O_11935 [Ilumatobacteraceae bacterium]